MLCWFLPYINMNQPWVHRCPLPPIYYPTYPSTLSQSAGRSSPCHKANFHCAASISSAHLSELQFSKPGVLAWFLANLLSLLEKKLIYLHGLKCHLYDPKLIFISRISSMNSRFRYFNWELNNLNWFYVDILNLAHSNESDLFENINPIMSLPLRFPIAPFINSSHDLQALISHLLTLSPLLTLLKSHWLSFQCCNKTPHSPSLSHCLWYCFCLEYLSPD